MLVSNAAAWNGVMASYAALGSTQDPASLNDLVTEIANGHRGLSRLGGKKPATLPVEKPAPAVRLAPSARGATDLYRAFLARQVRGGKAGARGRSAGQVEDPEAPPPTEAAEAAEATDAAMLAEASAADASASPALEHDATPQSAVSHLLARLDPGAPSTAPHAATVSHDATPQAAVSHEPLPPDLTRTPVDNLPDAGAFSAAAGFMAQYSGSNGRSAPWSGRTVSGMYRAAPIRGARVGMPAVGPRGGSVPADMSKGAFFDSQA